MEQIEQIINQAVKDLFDIDVLVELSRPDVQFGDFSTNIAMQLAKKLGTNPREIAQQITQVIIEHKEIASADVAGPGFINLRIKDQILFGSILAKPSQKNNQTVVIETNNPNPFKAMHIGHAFNAILADTIANLLDASGAKVHRVSYHGDVGSHVGKSMYSLLKFIQGDSSKLKEITEDDRNSFMSKMYALGAKAYKEDPSAKAEIDELAAQSFILDDPLYKEVYETCLAWSFYQIDELVNRLGNIPTEKRYLESQADALGVKTVKEHVGEVFIESDGALVFPGKKYGIFNNVFVGSNGRGLYGARDLGLIQQKVADFNPDKSYVVTAEEQKDYFRGVIKAVELCFPDLTDVCVNVSTGTVKLTSGKMSSRSGDVLEVSWLFDQITEAVVERQSKSVKIIEDVVIAAIRYQFLKVRIGSDVVFDINEAVNLQGNTGPYLQYSLVRAFSILQKAPDISIKDIPTGVELEQDEHNLLLKISEYQEVATRATKDLLPHLVANYLYELTQEFNRFYENNRVIDDVRQETRLQLVKLYADALSGGLRILGIPILQKM